MSITKQLEKDDTARPLAERKADVLDWVINNLLTESQLDVCPPGMSGPLRFTSRHK